MAAFAFFARVMSRSAKGRSSLALGSVVTISRA